jgi:hypothetical protein
MPGHTLPTKATFLANHLERIEKCTICHDPFDSQHMPTRIHGARCCHIFGSTCLVKWLDSDSHQSNACPMCRKVLFIEPRLHPFPSFIPGVRRSVFTNRLDELTDVEHAWSFVLCVCACGRFTKRGDSLSGMVLIWKIPCIVRFARLHQSIRGNLNVVCMLERSVCLRSRMLCKKCYGSHRMIRVSLRWRVGRGIWFGSIS